MLAFEKKQSLINDIKKAYDRSLGGPGLRGGRAEGIERVLQRPLLCEEDDTVVLEKLEVEDLSDIEVLAMSAGTVTIPGPGVFVLLCDIDIKFTII